MNLFERNLTPLVSKGVDVFDGNIVLEIHYDGDAENTFFYRLDNKEEAEEVAKAFCSEIGIGNSFMMEPCNMREVSATHIVCDTRSIIREKLRGRKKFNPEISETARKLIGKAFKERREELGMFQTQLAECTGLMQRAISNFESGKENITLNSLIAIAGCLRMEIQFHTKDPESVPGFDKPSMN